MSDTVSAHLEALAGLDVATIYEAQGAVNALPPQIRPIDRGQELTGAAYPVTAAPGDNLWLHRAVVLAPAGSVLVVGTSGAPNHGYVGEILVEAALAAGLRGLVIDGGVRDSAALRRLPFPVFSRSIDIRGTAKDPGLCGGAGNPVSIGGVPIDTGDYVRGDDDGVVVVEHGRVAEVIDASRARLRKEAAFIERIRTGESTLDLYDLPR